MNVTGRTTPVTDRNTRWRILEMAEDALVGFKFKDNDDDIAMDAEVLKASDLMFSEVSFDHLKTAADTDKINIGVGERGDGLESFDYTEGFDFVF